LKGKKKDTSAELLIDGDGQMRLADKSYEQRATDRRSHISRGLNEQKKTLHTLRRDLSNASAA